MMVTNEMLIDEIMQTKNRDLMINMLWDDPTIRAKIAGRLQALNGDHLIHYHKHYCGGQDE